MKCPECNSEMKYDVLGYKYICEECNFEIRENDFQDANFDDWKENN